tara:strand:- start:1383 stop:1727 length:345 start_codon:yes stop_codon:yes gene_type:complete
LTALNTLENVEAVLLTAQIGGKHAAETFFADNLGGVDQWPCGFAGVHIKVKGNTKLGKLLKAAGLRKSDYYKSFMFNTGGFVAQNMDVNYAGAVAAAEILNANGIEAHAWQRID